MPDSPTFIAKVEGRRLVLPALREPQLRPSQCLQQYALQNDDVETRRLELPKMLESQLLQQGNLPGKRLRCRAASPMIRAFYVAPACGKAGRHVVRPSVSSVPECGCKKCAQARQVNPCMECQEMWVSVPIPQTCLGMQDALAWVGGQVAFRGLALSSDAHADGSGILMRRVYGSNPHDSCFCICCRGSFASPLSSGAQRSCADRRPCSRSCAASTWRSTRPSRPGPLGRPLEFRSGVLGCSVVLGVAQCRRCPGVLDYSGVRDCCVPRCGGSPLACRMPPEHLVMFGLFRGSGVLECSGDLGCSGVLDFIDNAEFEHAYMSMRFAALEGARADGHRPSHSAMRTRTHTQKHRTQIVFASAASASVPLAMAHVLLPHEMTRFPFGRRSWRQTSG